MKWIVLLAAFVGAFYTVLGDIIRYRSADNPTPDNVSDVFDAETYGKWKRYHAEHCRLSILFGLLGVVVTLLLLVTDVYAAFAALFPSGNFWQLLAVVVLETVVGTVVSVCRSYVETMIIEQKYGFNRSTHKTFVFDRIRELILGLFLTLALVLGISFFHQRMGAWMILVFAAVVFCFTLLISFLYPVFSRIGNKFTPLEEGELQARLMKLLTDHGYRVKAIEVMDASRRTTKLNAYFTGFGRMKTIVLYDNLVNAMDADEICAVFAHELGHGLHRDVPKMQLMNVGNLVLMAAAAFFAADTPALHTAFGFAGINYGFAYVLTGIILGIIQPLTGMLTNAYSRTAEYRADRQAVKEGYGSSMVTALKKLARDNFAHLAPSRFNVLTEYSHPPLSRRIAAIEREMEKEGRP